VSTTVDNHAGTAELQRFTTVSRILHWLTAILVFSTLLIGFTMVSTVTDYATLLKIHKTLGVIILAVAIIRVVNRLTHRPPALPPTVGRFERVLVMMSEMALYALLLAQPLVGWAMVSAGGRPVVVFGSLRLPRIAPVNLDLFSVLRETHSVLAFLLVAVVAAHVSAVLAHSITLRDRMLARMTFHLSRTRSHPAHRAHQVSRGEPAAPAASVE
jgi:cytochrome b561